MTSAMKNVMFQNAIMTIKLVYVVWTVILNCLIMTYVTMIVIMRIVIGITEIVYAAMTVYLIYLII